MEKTKKKKTKPRRKIAPTAKFSEHLRPYFEDEPKMVSKLFKIAQKRSQNDPKMVQDWLKLRKIAPKTAQDSSKSASSEPVSSQVVHTQSHMYAKKLSHLKPPRYLKVSLSAI